ncbi:sensor histidine kinase [Oxynema aestuarii]|uniref:histidine kinase n=1 Tax=Oxynema aestuarii AP17 TaxID=2064643 RepID=A0A6H1TYG0_9CYAN|nr:HAMP domain-containing sensor histidine kinase [Oxynema aestuarii]QIZ71642.1 HAMP domain-containing histidine kinase [Oxynema aestuarii AP17]
MFNRSRRNLARWFTLSMGSILTIFCTVLYVLELRDRLHSFDLALADRVRVMASSVEYRYHRGAWQLNLQQVPVLGTNALRFNHNIVYARWYDRHKKLVQFVGVHPPSHLEAVAGFRTVRPVDRADPWLREVTFPVYQQGQLIGYLQVAISLASVREFSRQLGWFLTFGVPLALGAIGLTGWVLGGLAMQPIREAYDRLGRFSADASHELRAPLAAILNNAQVGLMLPVGDGSQQQMRLEKIVNLAKGMSELVGQLLFLSRYSGRLNFQKLPAIDLREWLTQVVSQFQERAIAQSHPIDLKMGDRPLFVRAEEDLLRQALFNLLDNACQYSPPDTPISIRLYSKLRHAAIAVEDNGIGIPSEDLPHIFDRFYRVDLVRRPQHGSFGLGLSIVAQIVEVHGGTIGAASAGDRGTTFTLELPICAASPAKIH